MLGPAKGRKRTRSVGLVSCAALLILTLGEILTGCGSPQPARPLDPLVPVDGTIAHRSYSDWAVAALQWRDGLPKATTPGTCISTGQSGKVWFLGGPEATPNRSETLSCSVPAGDYLLAVGPGWGCSDLEARGNPSDEELRRCAQADWHTTSARYGVALDGMTLRTAGFLLATPEFTTHIPAHDSLLSRDVKPGRLTSREVSYGYAMMLRPLTPGRHTLVEAVHFRGQPAYTIRYDVIVR